MPKPPPTPPPLPKYQRDNFNQVLRAAKNGHLALVSAIRVRDNQPVALICAMQTNPDESITPVPFAELIEGNPFELYHDPTL